MGLKESKWVLKGQNGSQRVKMGKKGSKWVRKGLNVKKGSKWIGKGQNGTKDPVRDEVTLGHNSSNEFNYILLGSNG